MTIFIKTTQSVLDEININGVCYADNKTTYSDYAYNYLKEITGYKGLFFGIMNTDFVVRNSGLTEDLTSLSNTDNIVTLTLDIPKTEYQAHDYYSFSDLILYHDEQEFNTVEIIKQEILNPQLDNVVQCVFNRIEKEWIKKIN
ncbi:hypothetical protein LCFBJUUZ_CDS0115 [Staphylococcus phage PG-2021_76]|uniref:Uncharacterized protein n=1 Tax=Staphylococcus phage UHP46 TaxID=3234966 RepID=A0AB39C814_9CAUD|nr:hypothetical protein [Staphylococcus phage ZCSS1]